MQRATPQKYLEGLYNKKPAKSKDKVKTHRKSSDKLDENDIKIAIEFNKKVYQFESSIFAIAAITNVHNSRYVNNFNTVLIEAIAKYQELRSSYLRVDGQIGWHTLRHMVSGSIRANALYDEVGDAIWLAVDGFGLNVSKVKSIVYDPKQTVDVKILDDGISIRLGTQALRNYGTFVYALKRGTGWVRKESKKKTPMPMKNIPEKELLRLVDEHWRNIPAVYDPKRDTIGGWTYSFFAPRYQGRLVDKATESRLVEIKKSCKTWWDNNSRYIDKEKPKHRFHIIGKALVSLGCYDTEEGKKGKGKFLEPYFLERKYGDYIIKFIKQNIVEASVYCKAQQEIDEENKRKKKRENRAKLIRRLHRDRLQGVYRWKEKALTKEFQTYDAWTKSDKGMVAFVLADELENRGYKGLTVPYLDYISHFPMCCVAIRDSAGVIVLKPTLYFDMPPLLQKLLQKDKSKNLKRYVKYILKHPRIKRVNSHMRDVLRWWAYNKTAPVNNGVPWDAYIDWEAVDKITATKPMSSKWWEHLGLRKYITDELKAGKDDDFMI